MSAAAPKEKKATKKAGKTTKAADGAAPKTAKKAAPEAEKPVSGAAPATVPGKEEAPAKDAKAQPTKKDPHAPKEYPDIDWTNRDQIMTMMPDYIQEQFIMARSKNLTKSVNIDPFELKNQMYGTVLLKESALTLEPQKKYALVGEYAVTSEFIDAIAGRQIKGFPKHLHVHHCKEIEHTEYAVSCIETVLKAHEFRESLLHCHKNLKLRIAADPAPPAADLEKFKDNLDFIEFQMRKINSHTAEERAQQMLRVLGFDENKQAVSTNALSGGLRMRVALCAAFFIEADILLLDEPTNHLDFPSVLWLENRLRGYRNSYLLVSHDRELLQNTCTNVIHLHEKKIVYYPSNHADFEKKFYAAQKKKAEEVDKFIAMNRNVDFSSPLAKELKEKKEWAEGFRLREVMLAGKFTFPDGEPLDQVKNEAGELIPLLETPLISVKDLRFSYNPADEKMSWIFDDPVNITVTYGSRVSIMGPNGAGKSTFLKLITGHLTPCSGTIETHKTARIAYFGQHSAAELDLTSSPMEWLSKQFPDAKSGLLRVHLQKLGIFNGKEQTRMVGLTAGQRSCVVFAKITWKCPHLLIMDEPTNFLDLDSVDALINATNKYTGALLLVSHNRNFLNKCAKQYLSIIPGVVRMFDDLRTCERATYTFIEELEQGVKVAKGTSLIKAAAGGTKKDPAADVKKQDDDVLVIAAPKAAPKKPAAAAPAAAAPAAKPDAKAAPKAGAKAPAASVAAGAPTFKPTEKVMALFTDGKWYPARVDSVRGTQYSVTFLGYGNKSTLPITSLKPFEK
jgi:ATP-binding cassette subfamily F protein 3